MTVALRPHPWNTGFEWADHLGPHRLLSPEQVRAFDERGFVVLDDVFSAAEIAAARKEIDGHEAKVDRWLDGQEGQRSSIAEKGTITFATNLVARSDALARFVRHPALLGIVADLVGPDANLYWDQAVYKKPEKPRRFPWHQDTGYTVTEPQSYLTCWIALVDATEDNGCPCVATGLHRPHLRAHLRRPARLGVLQRAPRRGRPGPGGRRRRRGVLLPHAAPHRPEHDGRGAQGLHRTPPPGRWCSKGTRPWAPHQPGDRPTTRASSSPCCAAGRRRADRANRRGGVGLTVAGRRPVTLAVTRLFLEPRQAPAPAVTMSLTAPRGGATGMGER